MPLFLIPTIQRNSVISFPMLGGLELDPPAYFTVFGFRIYFYGVLIALGFILAMFYCSRHAPRLGIRPDDFFDLMLWIIPIVIVGARAYYVLFRLDYYLANPAEIVALRDGGLAIYGGVIAGVLVIWLFCRHRLWCLLSLYCLFRFRYFCRYRHRLFRRHCRFRFLVKQRICLDVIVFLLIICIQILKGRLI